MNWEIWSILCGRLGKSELYVYFLPSNVFLQYILQEKIDCEISSKIIEERIQDIVLGSSRQDALLNLFISNIARKERRKSGNDFTVSRVPTIRKSLQICSKFVPLCSFTFGYKLTKAPLESSFYSYICLSKSFHNQISITIHKD